MQNFLDKLGASFLALFDDLAAYAPRFLLAAVVLVVALFLARRSKLWTTRALRRVRGLAPSAVGMISSTVNFAVWVLGAMAVLQVLNLGGVVFSAIASLGVVGLIVGFALQDITKQFVSGLILLASRPFEVGDNIRVGAHEGTVMNLQLRVTVLQTAGGDEVLIPNADVYASTVYNLSRYPKRRIAVPFTIPVSDDLETLRERLLSEIQAIPGIESEPKPTIASSSLTDGKVAAEVRYWLKRTTPNQDEITTRVIVLLNQALESKPSA